MVAPRVAKAASSHSPPHEMQIESEYSFERPPCSCLALVVTFHYSSVLVNRRGSKLSFPIINFPEPLPEDDNLGEHFRKELQRVTGAWHHVELLYSSISEERNNQSGCLFTVILECAKERPVDQGLKDFKWVDISTVVDRLSRRSLSVDMAGFFGSESEELIWANHIAEHLKGLLLTSRLLIGSPPSESSHEEPPEHVCRQGFSQLPYIALVIDPKYTNVIVLRKDSETAFPAIKSPEVPHRGHHMSECFSKELERVTGTRYNLVFLYSSLNETFQRTREAYFTAIFECVGPIDPDTGHPVAPLAKKYEWMHIGTMVDGVRKNTLVTDKECVFDVGFAELTRVDYLPKSAEGIRPWEETRWHIRTSIAATATLTDLGYRMQGRFLQHQISPTAAVLRAHTDRGRIYLKGSSRREGRIMAYVSTFAPYLVPKPLYVNTKDEWMLMEDYGETLAERMSRNDFESILRLHGKLQLESVKHVKELTEIGLDVAGPACLYARARKMLGDAEMRERFEELKLFADGTDDAACDVSGQCEAVGAFLKHIYDEAGLPVALVHGDVYDENIIKRSGAGNGYVLYDWGSARIDLPFSDVTRLVTEVWPREREQEDSIDSYLQLWSEYGCVMRLRELVRDIITKDSLQKLLWEYEYAKKSQDFPYLDDSSIKTLRQILVTVSKRKSSE